jgi:hypothetical protein
MIKVVSDGTAQGTKVLLDGVDIAGPAENVELSMPSGEPMRVHLTFVVGSLEAPVVEPAHRPVSGRAPGAI